MADTDRQAISCSRLAALAEKFLATTLDPELRRFEEWVEPRDSGLQVEIEPYDLATSRAVRVWDPQHSTLDSVLLDMRFEIQVSDRPRTEVVLVAERRQGGRWVSEPLLSGPICNFDADRIYLGLIGILVRAEVTDTR